MEDHAAHANISVIGSISLTMTRLRYVDTIPTLIRTIGHVGLLYNCSFLLLQVSLNIYSYSMHQRTEASYVSEEIISSGVQA